ncbi:hypothetical protein [Anabaena sp. CCY 0017]|uniref:hypothetical protein n=1 Tax=Anabaena sp. CCY 0017 TaxID=3103866 RepID=UPI0039C702D4
MGWVNVAAIPISDDWQFTYLIDSSVEWIRVRNILNSDPLFINYGYIAQVDNYQDFADFSRIYPVENNTVLEMKKPLPFSSRRFGVRKRAGVKSQFFWIVEIDVWV